MRNSPQRSGRGSIPPPLVACSANSQRTVIGIWKKCLSLLQYKIYSTQVSSSSSPCGSASAHDFPHSPLPSQFHRPSLIYLRRLIRCLQRSSWTCFNRRFVAFNGPGALPFFVLFSGYHRASSKGLPRTKSAAPSLFLSSLAWSRNATMESESQWRGSCHT